MSSAVAEAGPAHAPLLAVMHRAVFPHAPWNVAAFLSLLGQPGMLGLLHEAGGFLLVRAVLDEAEIITLGAVETRQGIASALLREALRRLRAAGVHTLYLEVAAGNAPARALYDRFGFALTGRRKAYYENGDDALTMRLELDAPLVHRS